MICIPCREASDTDVQEKHEECTGPGSCLCQHRPQKGKGNGSNGSANGTASPGAPGGADLAASEGVR